MSRLISTSDFRNVVTKRKSEYGKLATLISAIVDEMVRETPTVPAIPLDKVKKAREEIIATNDCTFAIVEILDKLIESEVEE